MGKAELMYMLRKSRHSDLALGLDSTKHTSIDVDVRDLPEYLVLKNLGMYILPKDLHWIYSVLDPNAMQRLNPDEFGIVIKEGAMGLGTSDLSRWHKRKSEHILRKVNLKPKYYGSEKESKQAVDYVREACENLTGKFTPFDISEWIKEKKAWGSDRRESASTCGRSITQPKIGLLMENK